MKTALGKFLIFVGAILIIFCGSILMFGFLDNVVAGRFSAITAKKLFTHIELQIDSTTGSEEIVELGYNDSVKNNPPFIEIDGEFYIGILSIPSLSLELPVNNDLSDNLLKKTPCRFSGDLSGSLVVSAHNYNSHFGKIPSLSQGDIIIITDSLGDEHHYTVEMTETLHQTEVGAMTNTPYDLSLFTCTPSRTERVTVRCIRVVETEEEEEDDEEDGEEEPAETSPPAIVLERDAPEAPDFKIDYKYETIKIHINHLYSTDGGFNYIEVFDTSVALDVSGHITSGEPIYIRKAATNSRPASYPQIIIPIERAVLEPRTLSPENGKLRLGHEYEVYDPYTKKWGKLPAVNSGAEFDIRLKSTVRPDGDIENCYAASHPGKLIITWGEYAPEKSGITSARIVVEP